MTNLPENEPDQPQSWPQEPSATPGAPTSTPSPSGWQANSTVEFPGTSSPPADPASQGYFTGYPQAPPFSYAPLPPPPSRIPHFGNVLLLAVLAGFGLIATGVVMAIAIHQHLFGIANTQKAMSDIHYILGSEALLYLFTFAAALGIFPLLWHKNLFAGMQWNGGTALRLRWRLISAAVVCFLLAVLSGVFMQSPTNTPIEKIFRAPGAAWVLFAFGVTFAPFFEETFFRGFLLPSLCTAYDWFGEKVQGKPMRPLGEHGHPQWSFAAMVFGSIVTSIPFAGMHAEQTGYALGPFLLLVGVSLVLCSVRLFTRSLASSVLVHACYNFLLFSLMLVGTGGFKHFGKI